MENKNFIKEYRKKLLPNYGLVKDEITPDQYVFGGGQLVGEKFTNGHWLKYIPKEEMQYNSFIDTYNCTAFGTLNCLETLLRRLYNKTNDEYKI